MAEVFVEFENVLVGPDRRRYTAQACGREREDGLWEGWLEFTPLDGSPAARTARETTQPNRADTRYWATGLTAAYLEGALVRALNPPPPQPQTSTHRPTFDRPADGQHPDPSPRAETLPRGAVLDPFQVRAQGEDVLREQLHALNADQLRNIVRAHRLTDRPAATLDELSQLELIALITDAVRARSA